MYTFRIERLRFKHGQPHQLGDVVVVVGPNNSGKSRLLKEILGLVCRRYDAPAPVVLDAIECSIPRSREDLLSGYEFDVGFTSANGRKERRFLSPSLCAQGTLPEARWPSNVGPVDLDCPVALQAHFLREFGLQLVAHLSPETRLQLVRECGSPTPTEDHGNLLQVLYSSGREIESEVREIVRTAFARQIALDFSTLSRLKLRVANDFGDLPADPRDARKILDAADLLDEQGHGIRSFVGVAVAVLAVNRKVFLIDEPEAFLHPPQSFRIGEFLSKQSSKSQFIVATHSTDVLRGILAEKTTNVTILRIDRAGDTNLVHAIDSEIIAEVMSDPLLSSSRVLDGLFYEGCVVVEADSDARFYQGVSRSCGDNIDLHFVNAGSKQTVPRIARIYRKLGLPSASVVDIDVLNDPDEFETHLLAIGMQQSDRSDAAALRTEISRAIGESSPADRLLRLRDSIDAMSALFPPTFQIDGAGDAASMRKILRRLENQLHAAIDSTKIWTEVKRKGRLALPEHVQPTFDSLFSLCAAHGLFINPSGELESMLIEQGIETTTDKKAWIYRALRLLPNLAVDRAKYPWKFITMVHDYLRPANR